MLSKRHHNRSTEKLLTPITTTRASSIEDLCIPPLDLQNKSAYIDEHSSSSASITERKKSFEKEMKNNQILLAAADIHTQLPPASDSSNIGKAPIPAPRRSLTSAFEFNPKHDKNLANIQRQENQCVKDDFGAIGVGTSAASSMDNSDSTPLVEVPKRVRPKSAKPSKEHSLRNRHGRNQKLPTIFIENESSNSMQSDSNEKLLRKKKKGRPSAAAAAENQNSHSDVSFMEKNEYELQEISNSTKDKGQDNLAYEVDEQIVQETIINLAAPNGLNAYNGSDEPIRSVASSKSRVALSDQSKSKINKKKGHRRTKTIDDNKTIQNTDEFVASGRMELFSTIIEIILHETSDLVFDYLIRRPRVKVSIYDTNTEQLLIKSNPSRNAVVNYEPANIDFIQPIISNHCTLRDSSCIECYWHDEHLIINEDIDNIQKGSEIIFFELVDILMTDQQREIAGHNGWYPICWAFLKPGDKEHYSNVNKQNCLQLFNYKKGNYRIYDQWKGSKIRYPATLTVTLKGYVPDLNRSRSFSRPLSVLEEEITENIYCEETENIVDTPIDLVQNDKPTETLAETKIDVQQAIAQDSWRAKLSHGMVYKHKTKSKVMRRYHGQPTGSTGSLSAKFSPNGDLIAFHHTSTTDQDHEVIVLAMQTFQTRFILRGHLGIIYALDWSNEQTIVSVSSDHTTIVWFLENEQYLFKVLPHPSYLYAVKCLKFSSGGLHVATGGRDSILRIWRVYGENNDVGAFELVQELNGHQNYITAITGTDSTEQLYTADYSGGIIEWTKLKTDRLCYELTRIIISLSHGIRNMVIHPSGCRMYIQCVNDSKIHSLEISSGIIIQSLGSTTNPSNNDKSLQTKLAISSCGSIIFSTINNEITTWNHFSETKLNTIKLAAQPLNIIEFDKNTFISSIEIHPKINHLLCYTLYGGSNLSSSMFLFNNKTDITTNELLSVSANDFIENIHENERAAVDRWRKIRQEIFADDQNIGTFENILERIDDLFHMAIKSPNHTDDYKENMIRCKDENVKILLTDRQYGTHAGDINNDRFDTININNNNDGNTGDDEDNNRIVDSNNKHEPNHSYAFDQSNESSCGVDKQAIEISSSASYSNDTFVAENKIISNIQMVESKQSSPQSNSSGTYNITKN